MSSRKISKGKKIMGATNSRNLPRDLYTTFVEILNETMSNVGRKLFSV
jgi:hypothetical protein